MFPDYWTCAKVTPLLIIIEKKARARARHSPLPSSSPRAYYFFHYYSFYWNNKLESPRRKELSCREILSSKVNLYRTFTEYKERCLVNGFPSCTSSLLAPFLSIVYINDLPNCARFSFFSCFF